MLAQFREYERMCRVIKGAETYLCNKEKANIQIQNLQAKLTAKDHHRQKQTL